MLSSKVCGLVQRSSVRSVYGSSRIGNREVVGHGCNGSYVYKDDAHFPFPAIRFKGNNSEFAALKTKEKCDWRQIDKKDKKALYRMSFCQTFAEFQASTGAWKLVTGVGLFLLGTSFWLMVYFHFYVRDPEVPSSLSLGSRKEQFRRMIELHVNPIDGLTSKWDYGKDDWNNCVRDPEVPSSLSLGSRKEQFRRMIELHVNPIDGLTSKWDYGKDDWNNCGWLW